MFNVIYLFSAILVFILVPDKYSTFNESYNLFLSLIYIFLFFLFLFQQRLTDRNWLRFDVVFLIGYTIVHFQIPFLASIGIEPSRPNFVWINKDVVNYATWMSTVAISLWMLGYSCIVNKNARYHEPQNFIVNYNLLDLLLLVSFSGFILTVGNNFLRGAYNVDSWGTAATYFLLILEILLYLKILYFFKELQKELSFKKILKKFLSNKLFIFILFTYILLFFLSGSRGEILRIFLLIGFAYSLYIKKISFKFVIVAIILGSFVFTLMGLGRGREVADLSNKNLITRGYENLKESDKTGNFTEELATSVRIQYRAIDTVPQNHPYLYGLTYIGTISGAVPFASGFVIKNLNIPTCYTGSASFFTCIGQGTNITYGEGSEILSDIYINFSLFGVFLTMFLFGAFTSKAKNEVLKGSFNYILVYSIMLITALAMNRGTILYAFKDIIYILFMHWLLSKKPK